MNLREKLIEAEKENKLPSITGFHRIDGPGSSLALPVFQRYFWRNQQLNLSDETWSWSSGLPRTVAITINTGTKVTAYPYRQGRLAMESKDYDKLKFVEAEIGKIYPTKQYWLLKIMELLGLDGVKFITKNLSPETKSSGLGGSATVTTAAAILANHLAGKPFDNPQLAALSSFCETDFGVSLTGTQEQWNVLYGGITDYVWFPWGLPHKAGTGYGSVQMRNLLGPEKSSELSDRILLVHSGQQHNSSNINRQWIKKFYTEQGYLLHKQKPDLAYQYAEGIRIHNWSKVSETIETYKEIRTKLCKDYMASFWILERIVKMYRGVIFPLGAGGSGCAMVWTENPNNRDTIKNQLSLLDNTSILDYKILDKGHTMCNPL